MPCSSRKSLICSSVIQQDLQINRRNPEISHHAISIKRQLLFISTDSILFSLSSEPLIINTCLAQLLIQNTPVLIIPVISGMFFTPAETLLVCLGILVYMIIMMWLVSKVFGRFLSPKESRTGMIMELPPYHKAHWGHILKESFLKAFDIFKRALSTVTIVSLLFWVFSFSTTGNVQDSLLYQVGTFIEPVTRFFGMGWQTFMGFLSSAFAKEAVLGVLNAIFVGQNSLVEATFHAGSTATDGAVLSQMMSQTVSKSEALAFMAACTFNIPCVMALTTTYRESHSFKWTARVALFYIGMALLLSCAVYHISALFM